MGNILRRGILVGCLAMTGSVALAPAAWGSITPTMSLDQSGGTTAGALANLGLDLKFAPTGSDSPDHMTLNLPPGLLANASIDGGACLKAADLSDTACQVGSGVVTADAYGTIPIPAPVTFDLVPAPKPGDLAGLAVNNNGTQIGSTADVMVRPSGDPAGVGVRIEFALPNALYGVRISITEINSTFDGLRYPTTCPATPAPVSVSVDSYGDSTVHTVTAPLSVTGCSSLSYSPAFSATAVRDSGDRQAHVTTQITQGASEAPSRSVILAFPFPTLGSNLGALGVICQSLSSGNCASVGSVTAVSPLYPAALSGSAYLTGSLNGLSLTLVFPSPFPLTLTGAIDLSKNSATFTGLPDIPLTNLAVSLNGGPKALFLTTCAPPSGTATATLTDQNGDRTVTVPSAFTVSGCPSGGGGPGGSGGGGGSTHPGATAGGVTLSDGRWSGLRSGRPSLSFRLAAARSAPKLSALTIGLPAGISFVRRRVGKSLKITGVTLTGAQIKSLSLAHGDLVITPRRPVSGLTVKLGPGAFHESAALRSKAKKLRTLSVVVIAQNTKARRTTIREQIKNVGR
jgi:hypothetical protein